MKSMVVAAWDISTDADYLLNQIKYDHHGNSKHAGFHD